MSQIRKGLLEGLNVDLYAKHEYNKWQMEQIRKGLLDVLNIN